MTTNIIRVRETEVGLQHLNDSKGNSDAPLFHSLKGVWLTLCCLTWTQTWTSSYPSLGDHCGYCSILSEYHLLRTKSGWNIRKKGWNADAWVAEDGRPHGTTWRVISWWPFLTSLFLPSLFRNTGASALNRNSQSPLEQLDLDSKEIFQTEEMAQLVKCLPSQYEDLNSEPRHIYQKTLCTVSQTQLWGMQWQADP